MRKTFTPKICQDKQDGDAIERGAYEGTVTLRMPDWAERIELYDGIDAGDDDEADPNEDGISAGEKKRRERVAQRAQLKRMAHVAKNARPFVLEVNIRRLSDGVVFDSWEKVNVDTELGGSVVPEVVAMLVQKFEVGKDATAG